MEVFGEMIGVYFYVLLGVGATASFYVNAAATPPVEGYGSILNVAFAYAFGIVMALIAIAPTSGGHLSPGYTLAFVLFKGFPIRKAAQYMLAQTFGAFLAALTVYGIYKEQLDAIHSTLIAAGPPVAELAFSSEGPAGVIALFVAPGANLSYVFLNEFIVNLFLTILVFAVLDPSNLFITFASAPFVIGGAYMVMILAFANQGLALNSARDIGGRLACSAIWGSQCWTAQPGYAVLALFTNIPATLIGAFIQVVFLSDTARPIISMPPTVSAEPATGTSIRALTRPDIATVYDTKN